MVVLHLYHIYYIDQCRNLSYSSYSLQILAIKLKLVICVSAYIIMCTKYNLQNTYVQCTVSLNYILIGVLCIWSHVIQM